MILHFSRNARCAITSTEKMLFQLHEQYNCKGIAAKCLSLKMIRQIHRDFVKMPRECNNWLVQVSRRLYHTLTREDAVTYSTNPNSAQLSSLI